MKRKLTAFAAILMTTAMLFGCGSDDTSESSVVGLNDLVETVSTPEPTVEPTPEPTPDRSGLYQSELTGEWIDQSLQNQRPIAVMVDNEISTYPHYGVNQADIVYEIMNSTANDRVTRFMCIVKDYAQITRIGGIRSIRPSNYLIGFPYEPYFCHDGGPYYIDTAPTYYASTAAKTVGDFSGIFSRFKRSTSEHPSWATSQQGKTYASEFTEFATYDTPADMSIISKSGTTLKTAIANASMEPTYSANYKGTGFTFLEDNDPEYLSDNANAKSATLVDLPFKHTSTELQYNATTNTYDLYEYGNIHTDAEDNNNVTTFTNVLVLDCTFSTLDAHGYMIYNYYTEERDGYYCTNGKCIPIKWSKSANDSEPAVYKDAATGENLVLNPGKIYITLVPSDSWSSLVIQ